MPDVFPKYKPLVVLPILESPTTTNFAAGDESPIPTLPDVSIVSLALLFKSPSEDILNLSQSLLSSPTTQRCVPVSKNCNIASPVPACSIVNPAEESVAVVFS